MTDETKPVDSSSQGEAASCIGLVVLVALGAVFWRQLRGLATWWWEWSTARTSGLSLGELVLFGLGALAALVALAVTFGVLTKVLTLVIRR